MRGSRTAGRAGTTTGGAGPQWRRTLAAALVAVSCLGLGACTSAAETAGTSSAPGSSAPPATAQPSPPEDALTLKVTEAAGQVTPNGQKIDARVGQRVVLQVTSDQDDEIHAHTGGDGYELKVKAGEPATGTFTLDSAGSFEVESHRLEKVIVILNAR